MTFCPPRSARPKASPNLPLNSDRSRSPVQDGELLTGLEPVFRASARVLVLGSLPGAMSLAQAQYYAHPRNQFWSLIGAVIGEDLAVLEYAARLCRLGERRIALWDVVASGYRQGSLDAALRVAERTDLARLIQQLPALRAVAFNGQLAAAQAPETAEALARVTLPSSSPANTMPFAIKLKQWRAIAAFLDD